MRAHIAFLAFLTAVPILVAPPLSEGQGGNSQKHPFAFEDMMALKRVEEPEVSPNGKWVLFAAVDVDLKANTKTPHVWVVRPSGTADPSTTNSDSRSNQNSSLGMTDGDRSGEKEIISDQDADRPRWAPDGKRFAFVSTKENGSQIWIADFDDATGTVAAKHRLTNIATEADGELWSPDGKNILFKSDVWPECDDAPESEAACDAKKVEEKKSSKVKALVFTHLLYRHWDAYKEGKRTHLFVVSADGCGTNHVGADASSARPGEAGQTSTASRAALDRTGEGACPYADSAASRDLTPGDYDAPVFSLGGQDDYAFSPDGQEICYASNHDPEPAISTNNDLFTVPMNFPVDATSKDVLAATKDITAENKAADNTPLYSPDGKYIAYRAQQRPGYESDRWRLMLYNRKTGTRRSMTDNLDSWPGSFVWSPDSTRIFFTYDFHGQSPVVSFEINRPFDQTITVDGNATETARYNAKIVVRDGHNDDLTVTPDGKHVLFTRMSVAFPNEIFRINSDNTVAQLLAHPPENLSQ